MQPLEIEPTIETPYVKLDKKNGVFIIKGKSLPEDVKAFYTPIVHWWDEYIKSPNKFTSLELNFSYFNTATSKMLLIILNRLKELKKNGEQVQVVWRYPANDAELENAGIELSELLNITFLIESVHV